jgi:thiol:disulfide interchange protein DsbD
MEYKINMYLFFRHVIECLLIAVCTFTAFSLNAYAIEEKSTLSLFTDDNDNEFLAPDIAFQLKVAATNPQTLEAQFKIAPNHYLYKNRIKFESTDAKVNNIHLPRGEMKTDANFGEQEVFHHDFVAQILLATPAQKNITLTATYQGCSEKGLCYAPIKKTYSITLPITTNNLPNSAANVNQDTYDASTRILQSGNLWLIVSGFFLAGLVLSFTPCVLPMIPILSGIIVGQQSSQQPVSSLHNFSLSMAYVLGMALSYTLAGIGAGLSGTLISQTLQNAWVLGGMACIFVALAFSMFGFYELQMPQSFEEKMLRFTNRFKGGRFFSVFVMGALSALIVSPCVAAPLAGALIYIGQTQNVLLGGLGLFALAIGMGMPLLAIGASAGKLLPKTGAWMNSVRNFFGVLMLGMAVYIVSPVIPINLQLGLWAAIAIISAIYLNALDGLPAHHQSIQKFWKGIGIILLVYGLALLLGALSGGKSIIQPLEHLKFSANNTQNAVNAPALPFKKTQSLAELENALAQADGKPVMLDFYADWCVACKEMEELTFSDNHIQQQLKNTLLLQADVTQNNEEDKALLKRFSLFGPPGIIFFGASGQEITSIRTIGFQNAARFLQTLQRRDQCLAPSTQEKLQSC